MIRLGESRLNAGERYTPLDAPDDLQHYPGKLSTRDRCKLLDEHPQLAAAALLPSTLASLANAAMRSLRT